MATKGTMAVDVTNAMVQQVFHGQFMEVLVFTHERPLKHLEMAGGFQVEPPEATQLGWLCGELDFILD